MPQLDIKTYYMMTVTLFSSYWIIFSIIYIAVSYSLQYKIASNYFKLFIVFYTLISVYSVIELETVTVRDGLLNSDNTTETVLVGGIKI